LKARPFWTLIGLLELRVTAGAAPPGRPPQVGDRRIIRAAGRR
jgi:hypothetical protein